MIILSSVVLFVISSVTTQDIQYSGLLEQEQDSYLANNSNNTFDSSQPLCEYGVCKYPENSEFEAETPEQRDLLRQRFSNAENPEQIQTQHLHHHFHYNVNNNEPAKNVDDYQRVSKNYGFERPIYQPQQPQQQQIPHYPKPLNSINSQPYKQSYSGLPTNNHNLYIKDPQLFNKPKPSLIRQDTFSDCVCVPYQYCSMNDVVDRSGDINVILPLDPRNNAGSDSDDIILAEEKVVEEQENTNATRSKRESKRLDDESEGRFFKAGGNLNKKAIPTVGISFGLPIPSPPINPFLNYNGLNLGLINVNPLFSLQYTRDPDYGGKVILPSINLHITPNEHLLTKIIGKKKVAKNVLLTKALHNLLQQQQPYPSYAPYAPYAPNHYLYEPPLSHPPYPILPYADHVPYNSHPVPPLANNFNTPPILPYADHSFSGQPLNFSPDSEYAPVFQHSQTPFFPPNYRHSSSDIKANDGRSKRSLNTLETSPMMRYAKKREARCDANTVCCRRPYKPQPLPTLGHSQSSMQQCGIKSSEGINGRIKTPTYTNGNAEFGEYPWQAAILKKDPKESVYVCGGTLISSKAVLTAAHAILSYNPYDLRARLGEWDVNHDVEFYPFVERDIVHVKIHPEYYAGTLQNDIAIIMLNNHVDFSSTPHIGVPCLPNPQMDFTNQRCWTTGWGKNSFGETGKYQNILKEVDVPVINKYQCQSLLRQTRLGPSYNLFPGMLCAGGEEGKDACKGDGGGPLVCSQNGLWYLTGIVSWGIGCGLPGVPGVYVDVAQYEQWIKQSILQ